MCKTLYASRRMYIELIPCMVYIFPPHLLLMQTLVNSSHTSPPRALGLGLSGNPYPSTYWKKKKKKTFLIQSSAFFIFFFFFFSFAALSLDWKDDLFAFLWRDARLGWCPNYLSKAKGRHYYLPYSNILDPEWNAQLYLHKTITETFSSFHALVYEE